MCLLEVKYESNVYPKDYSLDQNRLIDCALVSTSKQVIERLRRL